MSSKVPLFSHSKAVLEHVRTRLGYPNPGGTYTSSFHRHLPHPVTHPVSYTSSLHRHLHPTTRSHIPPVVLPPSTPVTHPTSHTSSLHRHLYPTTGPISHTSSFHRHLHPVTRPTSHTSSFHLLHPITHHTFHTSSFPDTSTRTHIPHSSVHESTGLRRGSDSEPPKVVGGWVKGSGTRKTENNRRDGGTGWGPVRVGPSW